MGRDLIEQHAKAMRQSCPRASARALARMSEISSAFLLAGRAIASGHALGRICRPRSRSARCGPDQRTPRSHDRGTGSRRERRANPPRSPGICAFGLRLSSSCEVGNACSQPLPAPPADPVQRIATRAWRISMRPTAGHLHLERLVPMSVAHLILEQAVPLTHGLFICPAPPRA